MVESVDQLIAPGQSGTVAGSIRSPESETSFGAEILIGTNDKQHPEMPLRIRGHAVTTILCYPAAVYFGLVNIKDLPAKRTVSIRPGALAKGASFNHLNFSTDTPAITVQQRPVKEGVDCEVTLAADSPTGVIRGSISVAFPDTQLPNVLMPFVAEVEGKYKLDPPGFILGRLAGSETVVLVSQISGVPEHVRFEIEENPLLKGRVMLKCDRVDGNFKLTAEVKPEDIRENIDTAVVLTAHDDSGIVQRLNVPVMVVKGIKD